MKRKLIKFLAISCSALCLSLSVVTVPALSVPVMASETDKSDAPNTPTPKKEAIEWVYGIKQRKLYKRLFNYSTGHWIGDWIYVRDLQPGEFE